ncbi:MAG TPA: hypothetical protein VK158_00135, partial [Acidobacteriota bacterium]|nr:hypothetical protein [Acidobacteriota bacterium]
MADKKKSITDSLYDFYYAHYKKILVFPLLLLILAFAQIGYHYATTGDFVDKGISLKGGISITVEYPGSTSHASELASTLQASFPNNEVAVRELADAS